MKWHHTSCWDDDKVSCVCTYFCVYLMFCRVTFGVFGSCQHSGESAASAVHLNPVSPHAAPHVEARHSQTSYRCANNPTSNSKQGRRWELTSSTVRGMHILYSFSNIFLRVSLLCVFTMCQSDQVSVRPPPDGMCVKPETCQSMWDGGESGLWSTPQSRLGSFIGTCRHDVECGARSGISVQDCPLLSHWKVKQGNSDEPERKAWGFKIRARQLSRS